MPARNIPSTWPGFAARFGGRVRTIRESLGLTQEELAHKAGISRNQIQNIENSRNNVRDEEGRRVGGTANPKLDTVYAIALALDVDISELLGAPRA